MLSEVEATKLAASLRRIRDDCVAVGSNGRPIVWYQGDEDSFDLFIETDSHAAVAWLQMTRNGRYVNCDFRRSTVTTGRTGGVERRAASRHPHSLPLSADPEIDLDLLDDLLQITRTATSTSDSTIRLLHAPLEQLREVLASVSGSASRPAQT